MWLAPDPPSSASRPFPPKMASSPLPPWIVSSPSPPVTTSLPVPPSMRSSPGPPASRSFPPPPEITSLPPRAQITSSRFVPTCASPPGVPSIVQPSAAGATVTSPTARSSAGRKSVGCVTALAALARTPLARTVTVTRTDTVCATPSAPRSQRRTVEPLHEPTCGIAETSVDMGGKLSVRTTCPAAADPRFVAETVNATALPTVTLAGWRRLADRDVRRGQRLPRRNGVARRGERHARGRAPSAFAIQQVGTAQRHVVAVRRAGRRGPGARGHELRLSMAGGGHYPSVSRPSLSLSLSRDLSLSLSVSLISGWLSSSGSLFTLSHSLSLFSLSLFFFFFFSLPAIAIGRERDPQAVGRPRGLRVRTGVRHDGVQAGARLIDDPEIAAGLSPSRDRRRCERRPATSSDAVRRRRVG